jgi:hypothetical protein
MRIQIQHAALLSIRRSLETLHPTDPPIPIILQDPEYTEDDKEAAESFEMTIVNGNFGYEKGWVELDDSTLLVDLSADLDFPVLDLVFEITRPAAIFTVCQYDLQEEEYWRYRPFSYALLDDQEPPEEITVPGLGIENRSA